MHVSASLVNTELDRLKSTAFVRRIAEWLLRRKAAWTPVVVLCSEYWLFDHVGPDLRWHWERRLAWKQPSSLFEGFAFVLVDAYSGVRLQGWVQKIMQSLVPFLSGLSHFFVLSKHVSFLRSIHLPDLFLNFIYLSFLHSVVDRFFVELNWFFWFYLILNFLFFIFYLTSFFFWLFFAEEATK